MQNDKEKRQIILDFMKRHNLGVISTADLNARPEAAVVEFGETNKLELIFDAFNQSKKCRNIEENNKVAFVIGWDENITVQYEGEASELKGDELKTYKERYFEKNPRAKKWEGRKGISYFKIVPHWIRYSDLNKNPWEIFEIEP